MKFFNYDIVFQEIPDEVSLAINISNCPNRCAECHSPHLWNDVGEELTPAVVDELLERYHGLITCLCLMGGDADTSMVFRLAKHIRQHHTIKLGWYSGRTHFPQQAELFDFIKLGPFIPDKGGLNRTTTNQRLYRRVNGAWEDITTRFWKREKSLP